MKVLVVSFSPLDRDPRVRRQLNSLRKAGYRVTAAGLSDPGMAEVTWWPVEGGPKKALAALMLKLKRFETYYWESSNVKSLLQIWEREGQPAFDLIIANDVDAVPVALKIANGAPVYADLHEYAPAEWSRWAWRFFFAEYKEWLCRKWLPAVAATSTVCEGIAQAYRKHFGIAPSVIFNAPRYSERECSAVLPDRIRLVHHGVAAKERMLEIMVDTMEILDDRYELYLYLVEPPGSEAYVRKLRRRANDRVHFMKPVPSDCLVEQLNAYDIGLAMIAPLNFNYRMCLPNKFFEFVQARLAIAIGPSPEMACLVERYDLGAVADAFSAEALASAISSMGIERILQCKRNADKAARELCYDAHEPAFLETVRSLVTR